VPRARVRSNFGGGAGTNGGSGVLSGLQDPGGIPDRSGRGDGVRYNSSKGQVVTSGVYIILNTANGKCYVGSSINVGARLQGHRKMLSKGCHENEHLQHSWDKYGPGVFKFKVVALCEEVELLEEEQTLIDVLRTMDSEKGYNHREAGNTGRPSLETRVKLRAWQVGKKLTPEHRTNIGASIRAALARPEYRAKLSAALKGNTRRLGCKSTSETRAKISAALAGHKHTLETRAKISGSLRIAFSRPGVRAKISTALKGNTNSLGHVCTPEVRKKMSAARLGKRYHTRKGKEVVF